MQIEPDTCSDSSCAVPLAALRKHVGEALSTCAYPMILAATFVEEPVTVWSSALGRNMAEPKAVETPGYHELWLDTAAYPSNILMAIGFQSPEVKATVATICHNCALLSSAG